MKNNLDCKHEIWDKIPSIVRFRRSMYSYKCCGCDLYYNGYMDMDGVRRINPDAKLGEWSKNFMDELENI